VTTKEAAARLGISVGRIRQLVLAGNLPAQKFGRDLMIKISDLADVKIYGKRGRPSKKQASADGEILTVPDAADEGIVAAAIETKPVKPGMRKPKGNQ
jgi:excisionase family DNA binding protein